MSEGTRDRDHADAEAAAHSLFEIEDDVLSLDRLIVALMMIGRGMSDREEGGGVEQIAIEAERFCDNVMEARDKAIELLKGPA
jgi:hypothetical protein